MVMDARYISDKKIFFIFFSLRIFINILYFFFKGWLPRSFKTKWMQGMPGRRKFKGFC
jgi:hypothetical protein